MPSLATLKKRAKHAWEARQKAKMARKKAQAMLKQLRQVEEMMNNRFHRALADYEQKAGPEDSDLGSSDETSSESG